MEVSTFEILAKPIAPVKNPDPMKDLDPKLLPVARRIVQGYFLTISNLEAIDLLYRIEFTVSLPVPPDPNKILLDKKNAFLVVDVEGANIEVPLTQLPKKPKVYRGFFRIPAHKTASVELLPKLPEALDPGLLEVRGYVSLFLPAILKFPKIVPQSKTPVKVLLNPEIRGTFLPNGFPLVPNPSPDFDQINYTLAIASGKGLNEITPEPGKPIIIDLPIVTPILEELRNGNLDLASVEADNSEKAQMLVQLLAQLDANDVNLKELNTVMDKFDIPVRMSRG
ncbi:MULTISPECIES: hypothetical protein [unclassified Microcoleus]|uniref:hypothetical protein n=1 Tax=unclassified Microcoleus TaxID=2642155 RepID=UPI002FD4A0B0